MIQTYHHNHLDRESRVPLPTHIRPHGRYSHPYSDSRGIPSRRYQSLPRRRYCYRLRGWTRRHQVLSLRVGLSAEMVLLSTPERLQGCWIDVSRKLIDRTQDRGIARCQTFAFDSSLLAILAVGGAVALVLGFFLGHVFALFSRAIPAVTFAVIDAGWKVNPNCHVWIAGVLRSAS